MTIYYYFGGETFDFYPDYKQLHDYLVPVIAKELKVSREEVEEMLEDDTFWDEQVDYYYDDLKDYFQHDAECEYEASQGSPDGFDDYDDFCRWRNPNL